MSDYYNSVSFQSTKRRRPFVSSGDFDPACSPSLYIPSSLSTDASVQQLAYLQSLPPSDSKFNSDESYQLMFGDTPITTTGVDISTIGAGAVGVDLSYDQQPFYQRPHHDDSSSNSNNHHSNNTAFTFDPPPSGAQSLPDPLLLPPQPSLRKRKRVAQNIEEVEHIVSSHHLETTPTSSIPTMGPLHQQQPLAWSFGEKPIFGPPRPPNMAASLSSSPSSSWVDVSSYLPVGTGNSWRSFCCLPEEEVEYAEYQQVPQVPPPQADSSHNYYSDDPSLNIVSDSFGYVHSMSVHQQQQQQHAITHSNFPIPPDPMIALPYHQQDHQLMIPPPISSSPELHGPHSYSNSQPQSQQQQQHQPRVIDVTHTPTHHLKTQLEQPTTATQSSHPEIPIAPVVANRSPPKTESMALQVLPRSTNNKVTGAKQVNHGFVQNYKVTDTAMVPVSLSEGLTRTKRGPFKDEVKREKTARTRKMGSCIRCKMQRIRCEIDPNDEHGPCLTCKNIITGKIWRLPCLRYKITEVRVCKPGQVPGYEWTQRWKNGHFRDIQNWESNEIKTIQICEGFTNQAINLRVRRFKPLPGDKTTRSWVYNGKKYEVDVPPYALVNLEEAVKLYSDNIDASLEESIHAILDSSDRILRETYMLAIQMLKQDSTPTQERDLILTCFRLWMTIRFTTRSSRLVGPETLGMSSDILANSPDAGMIPTPPVLGAQTGYLIVQEMQTKLRSKLLDMLQRMTQSNKTRSWLTTYVVIFILLHNAALITSHDAGYALKHGMNRRFAREDSVREYHAGANILLSYFHYCNKGSHPFSADCKDQDLKGLAELTDEQLSFVHMTRNQVAMRKRYWEELQKKDAYEDPLFYVSQMYVENWRPRSCNF